MPIELDTQLELALEGDSSHEENFAFGTALALAPNPGVQIDNLGLLSLPMTPSDAEQVKSAASGAPFGHMDIGEARAARLRPDGTRHLGNRRESDYFEES